MTETFRCGDEAGLVAYAYEDGEPAELAAVAAHVATCSACAATLASLADTRHLLASWTPPDARLGFRVTDETATALGETPRGVVAAFSGPPRPAQWWRQPLPAWAQAAAAMAIFGIGLWAGSLSGTGAGTGDAALADLRRAVTALEARGTGQAPTGQVPVSAAANAGGIDVRAALAALDSRIARAEQQAANAETAARLVGSPIETRPATTQMVTDRVLQQAIEQSESRQRYDLAQLLNAHSREQAERLDSRDEQLRTSVDAQVSGLVTLTAGFR